MGTVFPFHYMHQVRFVKENEAGRAKAEEETVAQLIPDVVSALQGEADLSDVNDRVKTVVGMVLENYFEDQGDMTAREVFGSSLHDEIDATAGEIVEAVADMYADKTGERFSLDAEKLRDKGRHFDSKKSAAIQNIGEGFSNRIGSSEGKHKSAAKNVLWCIRANTSEKRR